MSKSNCPNSGAPYLTLGIKCDYCGTLKDLSGQDVSYTEVYGDNERIAVFVDFGPLTQTQNIVTKIDGRIAERNRMLIHDLI